MSLDWNRWIQVLTPRPHPRVRLFCFHHAGGGASEFASWGRELPPQIEVAAVQLPGRESRFSEPHLTSMGALVAALVKVFESVPALPFAFFGHSMGALVAFELSRALQAGGRRMPAELFLSASAPPGVVVDPPISHLPESDFYSEVRRYGGLPDEIQEDQELLHLLFPMMRADFRICEFYQYEPGRRPAVRTTILGGEGDRACNREAFEGWRACLGGEVRRMMFPGDHFYLRSARAELLSFIARELLGLDARVHSGFPGPPIPAGGVSFEWHAQS